jgi:hypothetical protein
MRLIPKDGFMRWRYVLPVLHLLVCSIVYIALLIPSLQFLGIVFSLVLVADLPVSLVSYALGWRYPGIAVAWIFIAGTTWWYLLGRAVALVPWGLNRRHQSPPQLFP